MYNRSLKSVWITKKKLNRYKLYKLLQLVKLLKLKDFITKQKHSTIFIIVNQFTKWEYFIAYIKEILVENIV